MLFDVTAALADILALPVATPATSATNTPVPPLLSQVSRMSQGGGPNLAAAPATPETAILAAIRAGCLTPGAITTATRLGATVAYQELERMADAGLIQRAINGTYSLTSCTNEHTGKKT